MVILRLWLGNGSSGRAAGLYILVKPERIRFPVFPTNLGLYE